MAVNSMTFQQASTLINAILEQMTGMNSIAPLDESEFIAVGTTVLQQGYDALGKAVSQVLARSIYSSRAYDMVYPSIERDSEIWGGIVRKITVLDLDFEDDEAFNLTDGQTGPDPFIINKQKAVQFNFYGGQVLELVVTYTEDQLRQAFTSSADFGSFMAAQSQNLVNQINQKMEAESRLVVNNMIGAACEEGGDRVIHLFTEYQQDTGNSTIDITNYLSESEFEPFAKWFYGRINSLKDLMKERSMKFHANITTYNGVALSKPIMRHTPEQDMSIFMNSYFMNQIDSSALSGIYNTQFLSIGAFERVNYWQQIDDPMSIQIKPNILDVDGTCFTTDDPITVSGIVGVVFDRESLGITVKEEGVRSIENPRGRYFNNFYNWTTRWYNDQTENFVVLCLD